MGLLFKWDSGYIDLYSSDPLIFKIDNKFYDENGKLCERQDYPPLCSKTKYIVEDENNPWYGIDLDSLGTYVPLAKLSDCEADEEFYGNYGFIDLSGEYRIKPQYAYANNFSNGLACVNLKRTWNLEDDGKYYYRNHYGYIDQDGRTVIEFKYLEAMSFNKYGIAMVFDNDGGHFIDKKGKVVESFYTSYFSDYHYDYDSRFIQFGVWGCDNFRGLFDSKNRKIVFEPIDGWFEELSEEIVLVEYDNNEVYEIYYMD